MTPDMEIKPVIEQSFNGKSTEAYLVNKTPERKSYQETWSIHPLPAVGWNVDKVNVYQA